MKFTKSYCLQKKTSKIYSQNLTNLKWKMSPGWKNKQWTFRKMQMNSLAPFVSTTNISGQCLPRTIDICYGTNGSLISRSTCQPISKNRWAPKRSQEKNRPKCKADSCLRGPLRRERRRKAVLHVKETVSSVDRQARSKAIIKGRLLFQCKMRRPMIRRVIGHFLRRDFPIRGSMDVLLLICL